VQCVQCGVWQCGCVCVRVAALALICRLGMGVRVCVLLLVAWALLACAVFCVRAVAVRWRWRWRWRAYLLHTASPLSSLLPSYAGATYTAPPPPSLLSLLRTGVRGRCTHCRGGGVGVEPLAPRPDPGPKTLLALRIFGGRVEEVLNARLLH
jgi:hypothetical protein